MTSPSWETVPCDLCGSTRNKKLYYSPPQEYPTDSHIHYTATTDIYGEYGQIVRCLDCRLVYTNPRISEKGLLNAYEDTVDSDYLEEGSGRSVTAHFHINKIREFAKTGLMLELGCSTGYFLNAARTYFDVKGVEISKWAVKICEDKFKLDVHYGDLKSARYPSNHFDIVAMNDIIEHLPSPSETLKETNRILKPGGLLYIVTPSINSFSARILGGKWWGLRPAHIYYFSPRTLKELAGVHNFHCLEITPLGRIFTCGYWLTRLRNYPRFIYKTSEIIIRRLGIKNKLVYLNTWDSMQACFIKNK